MGGTEEKETATRKWYEPLGRGGFGWMVVSERQRPKVTPTV